MKKLLKFITSVCTVFGALFLLSAIFVGASYYLGNRLENIPPHTMVMIDFSKNYTETPTDSLIDEFLDRRSMSLQKLIEAIEMAGADQRIDGIVARIDVSGLDLAQIQDVARAIAAFRQTGKKTVVFSQGFGPLGQGNREYYLASFFEKIYMQPHTTIGLTGISLELPFARDTLDKIGVYPEFYTRYEYKTAMMNFTDNNITPAYYSEMQRLGASLMNELKQGIAQNRNLTENIDTLINRAPLSAQEGLNANMIDGIMYLSELDQLLKDEGIINYIDVENYAEHIYPNEGDLPTIAVVNLSGVIDLGESSTDVDGEYTIGSRDVLRDLSDIEDIYNLRAVVVRVNSPGGSYNAADEIYFALKDLKKKKNIPLIVSQSGYAASGGYFVSLAGDTIFAEPTTITGSIGVLGGKFVLQNLWDKLGVNWTDIKFGRNSGIMSLNQPFSAQEREIFNKSLDEVYTDFTAKVAENRQLKTDIDEIARGRVWTGKEALELGLVDALGNLSEALSAAREKSTIPAGARYKIVTFPREKSFSEKIKEMILSGNVKIDEFFAKSGVDIRYLKLFKRMQYDTVLLPFMLNM